MSLSRPKVCWTEILMSGNCGRPLVVMLSVAIRLFPRTDGGRTRLASKQRAVLERAVGLIHELQALLGQFIAAISIGVKQLGKPLIAGLDLDPGDAGLELQDAQRLILGGAELGSRVARRGGRLIFFIQTHRPPKGMGRVFMARYAPAAER